MWTAMNKTENRSKKSEDRCRKTESILTLFAAGLLFALVSCGGKQAYVSPTNISAAELNQKAATAVLKRDYLKALELYKEELRINRSIENSDGTAVGLLNIAAVYREMGDMDNASVFVNKVLEEKDEPYAPARLAGAAFLKALIFMDMGDAGRASDWVQKARAVCGKDACTLAGKLNNLEARIALARNDSEEAEAFGHAGLKINRDLDDREETANSLRILAEAGARAGKYKEAGALFEEALVIDKSLGTGTKVRADLMGLGRLAFSRGNKSEALIFFRRALRVSEAAGDKAGMRETLLFIEKCSTESGTN